MRMSWRHLLFMHYTLEPEIVQRLLPKGLTVDTFPDESGVEKAWIGVVPFTMCNIRPFGLPALPWISAFHETNVRTYVHHEGSEPGVWFFSLDAARWLACAVARATFGLPYHHADMNLAVTGNAVTYSSKRKTHAADLGLAYDIGDPVQSLTGTLPFWLAERYYLYSQRKGRLWRGQVHHEPYPLFNATVRGLESTISQACDLPVGDWQEAYYSPGVDVEVFAIERIIEGVAAT